MVCNGLQGFACDSVGTVLDRNLASATSLRVFDVVCGTKFVFRLVLSVDPDRKAFPGRLLNAETESFIAA